MAGVDAQAAAGAAPAGDRRRHRGRAAFRARGKHPPVCREMVRTLLHGHRYDGSRAERELGLVYTPARETLRRTVDWARAEGLLHESTVREPAPNDVRLRVTYLWARCPVASARTVEQMEQDLRDLIATVQSPHLRALLERVFGPESQTWERVPRRAGGQALPPCVRARTARAHLTVAQAVSALSAIFPGVNRDLAVTGALLHDIGKLDTYAVSDDQIEMTDAGRLHGEIVLGYARIRDEIGADRRASRPSSARRCCTSSSATTAHSSTARRWCRARVRRRSCTWPTTSARSSAASTGSSAGSTPAPSGPATTAAIGTVAYFGAGRRRAAQRSGSPRRVSRQPPSSWRPSSRGTWSRRKAQFAGPAAVRAVRLPLAPFKVGAEWRRTQRS